MDPSSPPREAISPSLGSSVCRARRGPSPPLPNSSPHPPSFLRFLLLLLCSMSVHSQRGNSCPRGQPRSGHLSLATESAAPAATASWPRQQLARSSVLTSGKGPQRQRPCRVGREVVFKRFKLWAFKRPMFKHTAPLRLRMFKRFKLFKRGLNIKLLKL